MSWKTWTKISGIILFILAIAGFYYTNVYKEGAVIAIQNFPENLDSLDGAKDITFSFYLYNTGDETAFVESIILLRYFEDGSQVTDAIEINPKSDFPLAPGESQEIFVTLPSQEEKRFYTLIAEVFYNNQKVMSDTIPVAWGTLL